MELKELRIGNWVKDSFGNYLQVDADSFMRMHVNGEDNPIPITEEILLKAGFDEESEKPINYSANLYVDMVSNEACVGCEYDGFHLVRSNLKYVHQLQNLYFALTGEELNIEL